MYFITTKRMLEVCFFQHTPTFIIEPYFFILISISDIPLYSVIIFDLLIQITARATANPPDSTLLII